jgi:chromosome segregation ATPase
MKELKLLVEKIDVKLDKVDERLGSIDGTLIKQEASLEHHIYRTELNEKQLEILREEMKPLSKHVSFVNAVFRMVGIVATGLGLLIGVAKIATEYFFKLP